MKAIRSTVKLKNNEMDYFRFGTGKTPFVMLPGLSVKSIMNSADSIAVVYKVFAEDFTVYCFDKTKILYENYTVEQLSEDTAEATFRKRLVNRLGYQLQEDGTYLAEFNETESYRVDFEHSLFTYSNRTSHYVYNTWPT